MSYSLSLPMPSAVGSIDSYITSVKHFPVLTPEEELDFATRFRRDNDLDAARALVLSHLRVVVSVARGYAGYGLPQADLIQEGNVGLMKAVKRFDPDRGVRLVSFALHWIRAEIHEYILRNWRLVKIATTKAQRKLFFNLRRMKHRLGWFTQQEIADVAKDLGVAPEAVMQMEARLNSADASFDAAPDSDAEEAAFSPSQYLVDKSANPEQVLEQNSSEAVRQELLYQALDDLDERSKLVLNARWLSQDKATLHELAAKLGVSAERIRQIEVAAFKKIKAVVQQAA